MKRFIHLLLACLMTVGWVDVRAEDTAFPVEIRRIFERSCIRCHGPEKPKSGYRLDNRADALRGGDIGVAIVPGLAEEVRCCAT